MSDPKVFKNMLAVLSYLKGSGFKIAKSKLYSDAKTGLLRVQENGSVFLADVKGYAQTLQKFTGRFSTPGERTITKLDAEINKLHEQIKALQWTREKDSGKYMLRSDFCLEMAGRAAVLDCGLRQMIRVKAPDLIAAVGGRAEFEPELLRLFDSILDEKLNEYASMKTYQVLITSETGEPVPPGPPGADETQTDNAVN